MGLSGELCGTHFKAKEERFEAAELVGTTAYMILANASNEFRNRDLDERNRGDNYMSLHTIRTRI